MSVSKEVRVGLLVTISLVIFFAGFYFLKGSDILSREKEYYCFYTDVQGLQTSANVQIHGLNVGRVSKTVLEDGKGVKVTIELKKKVDVPQGTVATLASGDLLGSKIIRLDLGKGPGMLDDESSLPTATEGGMLDNLSAQMTPLLKDIRTVAASLDTVLAGVNVIVGVENRKNIAGAIASLNSASSDIAALSGALKKESGEMTSVVHNANRITSNLADNNENINNILKNASTATDQLAKAPIQKTFEDMQGTISSLQSIINKVNSNEGSLGLLVNNKDLYNNLTNSLKTLNTLMGDVQSHPSRYINVTVFGKKNKD